MKKIIVTTLFVLMMPMFAIAQTPTEKARIAGQAKDEKAIRQVIANWDKGWNDFDSHLATQDYAEDADWINAFGRIRKGRNEIQKFVAEAVATPEVRSRQSTPSTVKIRFIRPDIGVVYSYRETVGQKTASGLEYPTRKTHHLRVMVKERGKWVIISHQIADEKEVRQ